ncbi:adenylate/guanylate cyclase domain-containing protein [Mycolicibacterium sp. 018/SC-01/001]|nr:adenylate/guanylate cyclase domain-containing protein [Mycolicibacterium sp. 018/SC-01/001]
MTVPIFDQLFVGRECAGISEHRRLVLSDKHISRNHFEIRLIADLDHAVVIDTSTNGTFLNGMPLARTVAAPIAPGDRITVGDIAMTFHSDRFTTKNHNLPTLTQAEISQTDMVMVVGDIVSYSTISEVTDSRVLAENMSTLWSRLDEILGAHHGTLSHYAGDAIYAVWNVQTQAGAHALAVDFALAAHRAVTVLGPSLALRDPRGGPIRMGWSVVQGSAAQTSMARAQATVLGDSTNLAFRLASIAGRDGRAAVVVTGRVHDAVAAHYLWGVPEDVTVKGRQSRETIYPAISRLPTTPASPASPAG